MNDTQSLLNGSEKLADHFNRIEQILADLKHKVEASKARAPEQRHPPDPAERGDRIRALLGERGSLTASDVQLELGVSHTTAMRTIQAIARDKAGIMVLEQSGPTFRVRLWHPDRVILDHVPR
jgi:hypothetical protein